MSAASRRGFLAAAGGAGATALAGGAQAAGGPREVPLLRTYAAGAGRYCPPGAFARLAPGDALALRREPDNDYDARAVSIWSVQGEKLGYVPRVENQALANLMDAGLVPVARVEGVSPGGTQPKLTLDMRLALTS